MREDHYLSQELRAECLEQNRSLLSRALCLRLLRSPSLQPKQLWPLPTFAARREGEFLPSKRSQRSNLKSTRQSLVRLRKLIRTRVGPPKRPFVDSFPN